MTSWTVEDRIEMLERSNRRMKAAIGAGIAIAIAMVAGGAAQQKAPPGPVEASAFYLVGPDGKRRAELAMTDDGPALYLRDKQEWAVAELALGAQGPYLSLSGPSRAHQVRLQSEGDRSGLAVADKSGSARLLITAGYQRQGIEVLNDRAVPTMFCGMMNDRPVGGRFDQTTGSVPELPYVPATRSALPTGPTASPTDTDGRDPAQIAAKRSIELREKAIVDAFDKVFDSVPAIKPMIHSTRAVIVDDRASVVLVVANSWYDLSRSHKMTFVQSMGAAARGVAKDKGLKGSLRIEDRMGTRVGGSDDFSGDWLD